eukprot:3994848-Prymnesium_polylepis.1
MYAAAGLHHRWPPPPPGGQQHQQRDRLVALLLRKKADLNLKSEDGKTAKDLATEENKATVVAMLEEAERNPGQPTRGRRI